MSRYAVIETGGKQYLVTEGQRVVVERLPVADQSAITFDKVLLRVDGSSVTVGQPYVEQASVQGKVDRTSLGKKVIVVKYRPKVRYRRKSGHRQFETAIVIERIA